MVDQTPSSPLMTSAPIVLQQTTNVTVPIDHLKNIKIQFVYNVFVCASQ